MLALHECMRAHTGWPWDCAISLLSTLPLHLRRHRLPLRPPTSFSSRSALVPTSHVDADASAVCAASARAVRDREYVAPGSAMIATTRHAPGDAAHRRRCRRR
eukprot:357844-Chlamydomonas_euryale.AAC.3